MTLLSGFVFYIAVINLPQRFQIVDQDSPVIAGVKLLPMMVASAIGSLLGGGVNRKRNVTPFTLMAASAFQLLGYGLMSSLGDASPTPQKNFGFQIFLGLGFGLTMPSVTIIAQLHAEPRWSCKSLSLIIGKTKADRVDSCYPRGADPNEISRRKHRSRDRCHRFQQPDQSLAGSCNCSQSRGDGSGAQVAACNSPAYAEAAGTGVESLRNGVHGRDACCYVYRCCMLCCEPVDAAKASSSARSGPEAGRSRRCRRRRRVIYRDQIDRSVIFWWASGYLKPRCRHSGRPRVVYAP